jgi:tRNA1Val (adenine37-N6)-methyltransferase
MPNPYFRFKQFTVWQSAATLKVCTEACILGAWAEVRGTRRLLDIGTGTGLLALMLAQRAPGVPTDAVEVDGASCEMARENVRQSPFAEQIRVVPSPIQAFAPGYRYDGIVANPPFFQSSLRSPERARTRALHGATLTLPELAGAVEKLLDPAGTFTVLLPERETAQFDALAAARGLYPTRRLVVRNAPGKPVFRVLTAYGYRPGVPDSEHLVIRRADGTYAEEFVALLKEYYLTF